MARVVVYGTRPDSTDVLREFLAGQAGISQVEVATDAEGALRALRSGADALLINVSGLGDPQVPELLEALAHMGSSTPVLLVGVPPEVVEIARAVVNGPVGIVPAPPRSAALAQTVQRVVMGVPTTSEEMVAPFLNRILAERRQRDVDADALASLTSRELTVLRLLSEGRRRGEIAEELGLSPNTVRTHLANLMHKLGTHTQLAAAMRGRELLGIERAIIRLPEQTATAAQPPDARSGGRI